MLFLAIHSKPRSRDEVFLVQKLDVKNSVLFVRNVVGACIYLGQEHLTVFFGFTGVVGMPRIPFDASTLRKNSRTRFFEVLFNLDEP